MLTGMRKCSLYLIIIFLSDILKVALYASVYNITIGIMSFPSHVIRFVPIIFQPYIYWHVQIMTIKIVLKETGNKTKNSILIYKYSV